MFGVREENIKLDAPLEHGPMPRWQRKERRENDSLSLSKSMNASELFSTSSADSPRKTPRKTPGKSPGRAFKTPDAGDRFIPKRSNMNFDEGHHKLLHENENSRKEMDPNEAILRENLSSCGNKDENSGKILRFKQGAPVNATAQANYNRIVYSSNLSTSSKKKTGRHIPQTPERVLDAPDFIDDYYLNLIHWGPSQLAVALSQSVYLWNAATGAIEQLCQVEGGNNYISSVNWLLEGNSTYLAVGTADGHVQLWDASRMKMLRVMSGHHARVGSLSWNLHILSSGCRSGSIHQHDVRIPNHHVGSFDAHSQEVCGLGWSGDGNTLASGGNDNLLCLWDSRRQNSSTPMFQLADHVAAVKAVQWCPWQRNILATGGGTSDRTIKTWNTSSGKCLSSTDTKSQVCGILWSEIHKEIISGHGYAQNQISIWKYPDMKQVTDLLGHTSRVLSLTMSPDKTFIMSASADETLRLWRISAADKISAKSKKQISHSFTVNTMR